MATEDENPDRLCVPQYHLKETIRKVLEADRCVKGARAEIEKQEKRLKEEHGPEKEKRELELREWMRRLGKNVAIYRINETQVIEVRVNPHYGTICWQVHEVLNP